VTVITDLLLPSAAMDEGEALNVSVLGGATVVTCVAPLVNPEALACSDTVPGVSVDVRYAFAVPVNEPLETISSTELWLNVPGPDSVRFTVTGDWYVPSCAVIVRYDLLEPSA